jgi:hypothetical protein
MILNCFNSTLASSLLNSIVDFLETGIDDFTASLYDWMKEDDDEDNDENGEEYLEDEDEIEKDVQFDLRGDELDVNNSNRDDHVKRIQELRYNMLIISFSHCIVCPSALTLLVTSDLSDKESM